MLQTYSCLQPLYNPFAHHPQVRQCKHHQQLAGVLGQTAIEHLAMTKLALDDQKRVLDLGANAGLEFSSCSRSAMTGVACTTMTVLSIRQRSMTLTFTVARIC